jgi:hypothetical protein
MFADSGPLDPAKQFLSDSLELPLSFVLDLSAYAYQRSVSLVLARMVNRVIQHGKAEAQSALGSIEEIRITLAKVANIDDFLEDLDAAERTLRLYLST